MAIGVICEYNPFHSGHAAMLAALRTQGAESIVCAMSGNFVQRGEPAVADKFLRAEAAVRCGADLVLELPTPWAMATAETFARGGVSLLSMAQCTHLAFGSECADLAALQAAADSLESPGLDEAVRRQLSGGMPYAAARQAAAEAVGAPPGLLSRPNDILAVEYLRAIRRLKVNIIPIPILRAGPAHDGEAEGGLASGSYIRRLLKDSNEKAFDFMPAAAAALLQQALDAGRIPVDINFAERAVLARLRSMGEEDLAPYDGGGEGLYHRVYQAIRSSTTLPDLLSAAKTKRYPAARLRRLLLAAWLALPPAPQRPPYLRVLAAAPAGRRHLRMLRDSAAPVLTKAADVALLGQEAAEMFAREAAYTDLYELCRPAAGPTGADWRGTPRMV